MIDTKIAAAGTYWDGRAPGYPDSWVPVLRGAGLELLDRVAAAMGVAGDGHALLDVGTGPGTLAIGAVRRWSDATVAGIDISEVMLEAATAAATRTLTPSQTARLHWVQSSADRLPFGDESFDAIVSAFVFQFLRDQPAALREFRRVLRPGGTLAWVTWRAGSLRSCAPDDVVEELFRSTGVAVLDEPTYRRSPPSPASAAQQARRAGFRSVSGTLLDLTYQFEREVYLRLIETDLPMTFAQFEPTALERFQRQVLDRWAALPDSAFQLNERIVRVVAQR